MAEERRMDILKKILSWGAWVVRFKMWLGVIMTGGILAWMASATDWMDQFAPFSWGLAFLLGALVTVWVLAGGARFYLWWAEAKYNIVRSAEPSSINPLEDEFQKQTIKIIDFKLPVIEYVVGKRFIGCHLLGPALILLRGATLLNSKFERCDFIRVPDNSFFKNITAFDSIFIDDCLLVDITVVVPESNVEAVEQGMSGLVWANQPKEQ